MAVRKVKRKFLIGFLQKPSITLWKHRKACFGSSTSRHTCLSRPADNKKEALVTEDKIYEHFISSVNNSCSTTISAVVSTDIVPSEIPFSFAFVTVIDISAALANVASTSSSGTDNVTL